MGDVRFDSLFARVRDASDRVGLLRTLSDDDVIAALGGATLAADPLLANVLATEAQNRAHRATTLTASLGEGVIALDAEWRITLQNPAAERMLGWTSAELMSGNIHALIHPFCHSLDECHLGTLPPLDFFYQNDDALVMRKDGRTIRVAYTVTPMTRNGTVQGGVIVLRDSSERKRQEEKSSEAEDRLERVLETLAEGVLTIDLEGRITTANAAAERILARSRRDITRRTYYDPAWNFVTPQGSILSIVDLPFKRALDSGESVLDVEMGVLRGDGEIVTLRVNTVPLPDARGLTTGLLVSFLDLARVVPGAASIAPPGGARAQSP